MFVGAGDGQILAFDVRNKGIGVGNQIDSMGVTHISKVLWVTASNRSTGGVRRIDVRGDRLFTLSVRGSISVYKLLEK